MNCVAAVGLYAAVGVVFISLVRVFARSPSGHGEAPAAGVPAVDARREDAPAAHYRIESVKYLAGAVVLRTLADANVPPTVEAGQVVTLQLAYSVPRGVGIPVGGKTE